VSDNYTRFRSLAKGGVLTQVHQAGTPEQQRQLNRDGYAIVSSIVFKHVTKPRELDRGHFRCTGGIHYLESDCLDRFQDDVEAVLHDLLSNAKRPIHNVEGWVRKRLNASTVNGYRRRRGLRGALQRPRPTQWLTEALHHDAWLTQLALEILEWVGISTTAGTGVWPLTAWAGDRARITGDWEGTERTVAADIEIVLAAMRTRPTWYEAFVERPLSQKEAPALPANRGSEDAGREPAYLSFTEDHEIRDARILEMAETAMVEIAARLAAGDPVQPTVIEVIREVFTSGISAEDLHRLPGTDEELLDRQLADPAVIDRVIAVVLDAIEDEDA
jgi:hypothetical protein